MSAKAEGVVHFYNRRGIAEQWIKEGKYALNWTRLSCKHFLSNQVRLGLFVLAYNLGNFLRRLVLSGKIKHWSLRTLLVKLIKIGAKVLRHNRYVIFQMAEVAISKEIFAGEWVDYYNNHRYHEAIDNVTPADKYFGRDQQILKKRKKIKNHTIRERRKINRMIMLENLSNDIH